jgi:integrase
MQYLQTTTGNTYNEIVDFRNENKISFSILEDKLDKIAKQLMKTQKKKPKPAQLRDAITDTIFAEIMHTKRPKGTQRLTWCRFRIACVILFFTGLRASEAAYTTNKMIDSLIKNKRCQFYQSKVNSMRICHVPDISQKYFDLIKPDIKEVYSPENLHLNDDVLLYPFIKTSKDKWIKLINDQLRFFGDKYNLRLKSHSFRISYVTRILKHSSIDRAKRFVGHKDIRSTEAYNRYQIGDPAFL